MIIAPRFVYSIALIPFCLLWFLFFLKRKDLRKEIIIMSILVGFLSMATSYFWWTIDWWQPKTITGTRIGIEDFIMGFTSGGIMASLYEIIFKKTFYKRKLHHHISGGVTILLLLAQTTTFLLYGVGLTSFWASAIAMFFTACVIFFVRKDLVFNALFSGISMLLVSILFYTTILFVSPMWINETYLNGLSGIKFIGVPLEEYVFWFLAGLVFGPFYEYWQGEKLRRLKT